MTRFLIAVLCSSLVWVCGVSFPSHAVKKPSRKQMQEMKQKIERAKTYLKEYNACKDKEMAARRAGKTGEAQAWKDFADVFDSVLQSEGDQLIHQVDQDYDIPKPAGTTIVFDSDSRDYAYVPKTTDKSKIKVVICPQVLSDGPGLVASTKIHELKHAAQVASCMSSNPGFWRYCNFWNHVAEWQAYSEEEKYYDKKITNDMPPKEKALIKRRAEEERKAALKAGVTKTRWTMPNAHKRAGQTVATEAFIYNASSAPRAIEVNVVDTLGWTIVPSNFTLPLDAEEEASQALTVDVPPGAPVGAVNEVYLTLAGAGVEDVSDTMFVIVDPTVSVTPGSLVEGLRGDSPAVGFLVENISDASDTFDIEISNPLGWSAVPSVIPSLSIQPGEIVPVMTNVEIPLGAPEWTTNVVVCSATSTTDPTQQAEAWVAVRANEVDIAALGIESPTSTVEELAPWTPAVWVMNPGHIDSFFDVFIEIEEAPAGPVVVSDATSVAGLAPGAGRPVRFSPVSLSNPGLYTARVTVSVAGDADAGNNVTSASFEVTALNVLNWDNY